jgi:uncharacterized protein (DUF2147 family)
MTNKNVDIPGSTEPAPDSIRKGPFPGSQRSAVSRRGLRVKPAMTGVSGGLRVKTAMTALCGVLFASFAFAQATPVGLWRSIDDKTGEPKAEVRISESAGVLSGRVERRLLKTSVPNALCVECKDDRKDQPMDGLEVIRGVKKAEGKDVWDGGKILDPESGRDYGARLTPIEGGQRLEVRGSFGPFGRTQTWVRVQ